MAAPPVKNTNDKTRPGGATILIVDDDSGTRTSLRHVFEDAGLRVITATNAPAALRLLHKEHCDLVMLDIDLPGVDGFALGNGVTKLVVAGHLALGGFADGAAQLELDEDRATASPISSVPSRAAV